MYVKYVGGFAFVFVAQDLKDGKEYALKVCSQFEHWTAFNIYKNHVNCRVIFTIFVNMA